jgi:hypothetical protein
MAINIPILTTFNNTGLQKAQKAFQGLTASTAIVGAAIGGVVTAVGAMAYKAVQAASDLNEAVSKTNVIFGAISVEVQSFARTAARSLGISETAALQAASTFATFGKAAGLAGKDLSTFSTDFVKLAADLASFNNTSVDQSINALGAALRGESEPLRQYGVLLNDATLKAAAAELGIYSGTGALSQQAKVLAAQKVIYEQTTDAQGDFARTSDGLANQQRILSATFENVKTNIGQALLPVFQKFIGWVNTNVTPAIERVADAFSVSLTKGFQQAIAEMGPFGEALVDTAETVSIALAQMGNIGKRAFQFVKAGLDPNLVRGAKGMWDALSGKDQFNVDEVRAKFDAFRKGIGIAAAQMDYSSFAAKKLAETARSLADDLGDDLPTGAGTATKKLTEAQKKLQQQAKTLRNEIGDNFKIALDTAVDRLDKARQAYDDFRGSISDSVNGTLSFKDALDEATNEKTSFIAGLTTMANRSKLFGERVATLLKMGLSKAGLRQVLDAGVEAGTFIADQLINGGSAAIEQTNELLASLQTVADELGTNAADEFYGAGVKQGEALVAGIRSVIAEYEEILKNPNLSLDRLREILGISSGAFDAVEQTVTGGGSTANGAGAPGAIDAGNGMFLNPANLDFAGIQFGPAPQITVNVNGGLATSAEIGRAVVDNIKAYNRANGPAEISVWNQY